MNNDNNLLRNNKREREREKGREATKHKNTQNKLSK